VIPDAKAHRRLERRTSGLAAAGANGMNARTRKGLGVKNVPVARF